MTDEPKRHKQVMPSGEVRVYAPGADGVMRLVSRTTAGGTVYDGPAIGETMEAVEDRFPRHA